MADRCFICFGEESLDNKFRKDGHCIVCKGPCNIIHESCYLQFIGYGKNNIICPTCKTIKIPNSSKIDKSSIDNFIFPDFNISIYLLKNAIVFSPFIIYVSMITFLSFFICIVGTGYIPLLIIKDMGYDISTDYHDPLVCIMMLISSCIVISVITILSKIVVYLV